MKENGSKWEQIPEINYAEFHRFLEDLEKMSNPPPFLIFGPPGIGKTQIIESFVKRNEDKYEMRKRYLSRCDPSDWLGIPRTTQLGSDRYTKFIPPYFFRRPENNKRLVIFFDELNTASIQVLNSALDIILQKKSDEGVGFDDNTIIVAAGNLGEEDGTYVEELSMAVKTRFIQARLKPDVEGWLDWAKEKKPKGGEIHFLVRNYISSNRDDLLDWDGLRNNAQQVATPRGWERISIFIKEIFIKEVKDTTDEIEKLRDNEHFEKTVYATIGTKIGKKFINFVNKEISEICKPPEYAIGLICSKTESELLGMFIEPMNGVICMRGCVRVINEMLKEGEHKYGDLAHKLARVLKRVNVALLTSLYGLDIQRFIEFLKKYPEYSTLYESIVGPD